KRGDSHEQAQARPRNGSHAARYPRSRGADDPWPSSRSGVLGGADRGAAGDGRQSARRATARHRDGRTDDAAVPCRRRYSMTKAAPTLVEVDQEASVRELVPRLLDADQIADLMSMDKRQVYRLVHEGRFP